MAITFLDTWEMSELECTEESTGKGPRIVWNQDWGIEVDDSPVGYSAHEAMAAIRASALLPRRNDLCPADSTCICRQRKLKQSDEKTNYFILSVQYSNQPLDGEIPDQNDPTTAENPLNRPAEISWHSEEVRQVMYKDLDGVYVGNSAGQKFEQAIERTRRRRIITITKNYSSWNDTIAEAYEDKVSTETFLNKPAGTIWCKEISASRRYESNMYIFPVTFVFAWDKLGWKIKVVESGTQELHDFGDGPVLISIKEKGGTPITTPVYLNSSGARTPGPPFTPTITEYRDKDTADFNALSLL